MVDFFQVPTTIYNTIQPITTLYSFQRSEETVLITELCFVLIFFSYYSHNRKAKFKISKLKRFLKFTKKKKKISSSCITLLFMKALRHWTILCWFFLSVFSCLGTKEKKSSCYVTYKRRIIICIGGWNLCTKAWALREKKQKQNQMHWSDEGRKLAKNSKEFH